MQKATEIVMVIPDTQIPFDHTQSIPFLKAVQKAFQPTRIIQIGDLIDNCAVSDYETNPDGMSAGDELLAAKKRLQAYYRAFPEIDVIWGNHDRRLHRLAAKVGIPKDCIVTLPELLRFPKTWTLSEQIVIDDVMYEHGDKLGSGGGHTAYKRAIDANMQSTVFGHFHSAAGIKYFANKRYIHFAMNVGCLMDTHSYAAEYGAKFVQKPILGCGLVTRGVPMFIPMVLTPDGRWRGYL